MSLTKPAAGASVNRRRVGQREGKISPFVEPLSDDGGQESANQVDIIPLRDEIHTYHLMDERRLVGALLERAIYSKQERKRAGELATLLVHNARKNKTKFPGLDALIREYDLSNDEGVLLMCVAESLLRIPDTETADKLINEKLAEGAWANHLGNSESIFVNASTWGLMLSGGIARLGEAEGDLFKDPFASLKRLASKVGEPVIRNAVRHCVRQLGRQFVLGRTIHDALKNAATDVASGTLYSYDMLGEAAMTDRDAERYYERYFAAIEAVGRASGPDFNTHPNTLMARSGVSIKLSALHPRFEAKKADQLQRELVPRLCKLVGVAKANGVPITFDAEEQATLEPLLMCFASVYRDEAIADWAGLGIAVQAYGKRAIPTLRWLRQLAHQFGKRIPVRLVKGAYWDSEIKWAQERALPDYPVLTQKVHTDVSYLAATRLLLSDPRAFYPQFATHNAHTIAAVGIAAGNASYEFQRLYGMGEELFDSVQSDTNLSGARRVYAPVGGHKDLLAYLVRRLLENGANASFVNRFRDPNVDAKSLVADPIAALEIAATEPKTEPTLLDETQQILEKPCDIHLPHRKSGMGLLLENTPVRSELLQNIDVALSREQCFGPIIGGAMRRDEENEELLICPHDLSLRLGTVTWTSDEDITQALANSADCAHRWEQTPVAERAAVLELAAELFERNQARLMALIVREAGKTLEAAGSEVREAVDFLRYYAREGRRMFEEGQILKGPTGETNTLIWRGRGPFVCISPWNFPLAIFVGQVAAALIAGNPVLAKPAEQTPATASLATKLIHEAGVPGDVLQTLPGRGEVAAALLNDPRIRGVAFTGSTETAGKIQRQLAARGGPILPFIAETGGINAMIADSSALTEQVVADAVTSAFDSAGQRCSAARVLFLQEEIADKTIEMLAGAIETLTMGDPMDYATDIGPVIDEAAQDRLESHKVKMSEIAGVAFDVAMPEGCRAGTFVTPAIFEVESFDQVAEEAFGPILHIVRFEAHALDDVITAINQSGYGLTLGVHSRLKSTAERVFERARVGNIYINRNQVGAVVGVQPFGGEGLSGTGTKAGGPNYLTRFATERVHTRNMAAEGGNLELLRPTKG